MTHDTTQPDGNDLELEVFWAKNTEKAYRADWEDFRAWCISQEKTALPAEANTIGEYLMGLRAQQLRASSIRRRAVSIGRVHVSQGHENPTRCRHIEDIVRGVHHEQHYEPERKTVILPEKLTRMVDALEADCEAMLLRDRAILLIGWASGFRRSELASLTVGDIEWTEEGVTLTLRRINRYQQREPDSCVVEFLPEGDTSPCPARALKAWLDAAAITGGPLFVRIDRWGNIWSTALTGKSITRIIKKAAEAAGLNPADYSARSFRDAESIRS